MNLKPFLLFAILAFFPIDSAQSIEHSLKLQKKCERLIKRFAGKASYEMNNNYYGKGVKRPSTSLWKLKRYSKPFFFGDTISYHFIATTSDGFTHGATCEFEGDGWLRNFCVEHFDWGCATLGDVVDNY